MRTNVGAWRGAQEAATDVPAGQESTERHEPGATVRVDEYERRGSQRGAEMTVRLPPEIGDVPRERGVRVCDEWCLRSCSAGRHVPTSVSHSKLKAHTRTDTSAEALPAAKRVRVLLTGCLGPLVHGDSEFDDVF